MKNILRKSKTVMDEFLIYNIKTAKGLREFKIAVGSNGYIVSFIPNW